MPKDANGEFFDPAPPTHRHTCKLPEIHFDTPRGWRCNYCGKAYIKENVWQHGESWDQWKRAPDQDRDAMTQDQIP